MRRCTRVDDIAGALCREALAPLRAAPLDDRLSRARRHAGAEAVRLRTPTVVRLKRSLRHSEPLSPQTKRLRLTFERVSVKVRARLSEPTTDRLTASISNFALNLPKSQLSQNDSYFLYIEINAGIFKRTEKAF